MLDLSVIILAYRSAGDLRRLLPTIAPAAGSLNVEVLVVDNSRDTETQEVVSGCAGVTYLPSDNIGFAKANNVGIQKTTGEYVLILNPDTELHPGSLERGVSYMRQHREVGVLGFRLLMEGGKLDLACRRRFPDPLVSFKRLFLHSNTDYNYSDLPEDVAMEVDCVVGAFMLVRRTDLARVGLLDESFFMYGEDIDWCMRFKEAGFKVWYLGTETARHYKRQSSKKEPLLTLRAFRDAMWIFYNKHYARNYPLPFTWLVWCGIWGRYAMKRLLNAIKR